MNEKLLDKRDNMSSKRFIDRIMMRKKSKVTTKKHLIYDIDNWYAALLRYIHKQ